MFLYSFVHCDYHIRLLAYFLLDPSYRLMDRDGKVLDVNADPRDLNKMKRMLDTITGGGK